MHPTNQRIPRGQRGSVVVNAVIALSLLVIVLAGTELGYLFFLKRELQKTVDLAALAGTQALKPFGCPVAQQAAKGNAAKNFPAGIDPLTDAEVECGNWDPVLNAPPLHFNTATSGEKLNAVRISITRNPTLLPFSLTGTTERSIAVTALAYQSTPQAQLSIRSTLVVFDPAKSPLLDAAFGKLLGGNVVLTAAGWEGLITTQVNLLSFLDAIALQVGIGAGQYEQVLNSKITAGKLLQALATVLQKNGALAGVALTGFNDMVNLTTQASNVQLSVAEILGIATGTPSSALDLNLQAFQLTQAFVQLANSQHAATISAPSNLLGLANVVTTIKVIEPPQTSAIGNPELAVLDPMGPNGIRVRTAQIRALISVDFTTALTSLTNLVNEVFNLTQPVTTLLNSLLHLDLVGVLSNIVCLGCEQQVTDLRLVPSPFRIDINLDVAAGKAHVDNYSCPANGSKTLSVIADTSAVTLRVGQIGNSPAEAAAQAFASKDPPNVAPIPLVDIGAMTVKKTCIVICGYSWKKGNTWVPDSQKSTADREAFAGGGIGLMTNTPVLGSNETLEFAAPVDANLPDISATQIPTPYQQVVTSNLIGGLSQTLAQVDIHMYKPSVDSALGDLLVGVGNTIDTVVALLRGAISGALSPLLDPLVNTLVTTLGIDLAKTEVGARLSCQGGAQLVY
ncbi:putative membrane protein [Variovorax paradoxus]|uniref:Membrane protein n=1 Tax=Variovorax paradoxus TaxID=34073 RepID=A0AAE3Y001_VARPD|nr:pilus assembly protein TadG-related protein [Variovorax paradoxus]MDR6427020.1 putative membrane protein [Variovorax paradoxus]